MSRAHRNLPRGSGLLLLLTTLILSACSTAPRFEGPGRDPATLTSWQLDGKVGIKTAGDGGSAYLNWIQQGDQLDITLYGPMGQGTTHIHGDSRRMRLEQPGQPSRQADSAETLMQDSLGWSLPLTDFRYWVKGIASPIGRRGQSSANALGQLSHLEQHGWQLEFDRYQALDDWQLPGKIVARRGDIQITLIIKHWAHPQQP